MPQRYPEYAESTKERIIDFVLKHPGCKGGEIAYALSLDKSRVNSFLYSEGKRRFCLQENNWRWVAGGVTRNATSPSRSQLRTYSRESAVTIPTPISSGNRTNSRDSVTRTTSICGSLANLSLSDATLKIRGMSEHQINLVFAEDEYLILDDRLHAELAIRRSELLASKPVTTVKTTPFGNLLVLIALSLMAVIFLGNVMNNSSPQGSTSRESPGFVR